VSAKERSKKRAAGKGESESGNVRVLGKRLKSQKKEESVFASVRVGTPDGEGNFQGKGKEGDSKMMNEALRRGEKTNRIRKWGESLKGGVSRERENELP